MNDRFRLGAFAAVLKLLLFDLRFKLLNEILLYYEVAHPMLVWLGLIYVQIAVSVLCGFSLLMRLYFFGDNAVFGIHDVGPLVVFLLS